MSWQRLSRPAATFSCSTMALFTKPKRSCWPIILSPFSSRLTHPNSILLSGSGLISKINWRVTFLPPWRNFFSRWLRLSLDIQPLTYAHLQRSLTSSRLLSQLMYTNHKETVLEEAAQQADTGFPENEYLRIENGVPVLKRLHAKPEIDGAKRLEQLLQERTDPIGIIDALIDTEHWLNWTHHFGPLSGLEAKLDSPRERYLVTAFCYGCNLGPTQTARSIEGLDRRHIAFVNQRHVTEERLNEAITTVVNAYASLGLQKLWGSGRSASADGTQWELYPQNLIATYHIRYGDYGGIGYYLVAASYIALFSRFIACGTWEGHHILDFINENRSDV